MEITLQNSDNIFLQIYFGLLSIGVDKTRSDGPTPGNSRYELISWGIIKILFGSKPAKIEEFSRSIHISDNMKIKKYEETLSKDINLSEKHNDILKKNFCTNTKVTDFFTLANRKRVAGAFIALMKKIDALEIDAVLKSHMETELQKILCETDYKEAISRSIREKTIKQEQLDISKEVTDVVGEYLKDNIILITIKNKEYIRFKNKGIVLHEKNRIITTYFFFKNIISGGQNLNNSDLIHGCYDSLKQHLFQKLKTII